MKMKVILTLVLAMALAPAAMADYVHFGLNGISWSWAGGATPLTGSVGNTPPSSYVNANGQVGAQTGTGFFGPASFSTGNYISGTGTAGDPFKFDAAANGSFVIDGCGGACFTGQIVSLTLAHNASGNLTFTADIIVGDVSNALFLAMGIVPPAGYNLTGWMGSLSGNLVGTADATTGGSGTAGSLDMTVAPVPEPGTLALFGSGLIGIAGVIRRKISAIR